MLATVKQSAVGKRAQRGFTLIELLIVILIVGILAAVGVPLYLGYTKDAKLAEGKALAGSTLTTLQACAASKGAGGSCDLSNVWQRIGVSSAGVSGDGRWTIDPTSVITINSNNTYSGTIKITGTGTDNANMAAAIFGTGTGIVLRCELNSSTPPASPSAGEPC
jgi:prepilin-type N-terminal cleavage/methylation domain-containing protein